jgi:hypothetical protein
VGGGGWWGGGVLRLGVTSRGFISAEFRMVFMMSVSSFRYL